MSKTSLTKLMPLLEALPGTEVKGPNNIPVTLYLREAHKLVALGEQDLESLKGCGFREEMLDDMRDRIGALREAESQWKMQPYLRREAGKRWDELCKRGFHLRDELEAALRFVETLRKESGPVKNILKGKKPEEVGANLRELAALANERREALEEINFDLSLSEEAAELADALDRLRLEVEEERELPGCLKRLRDRAFSYLREAVERLRSYARYVFRNNREQRERYASDYLRAKRRRLAKKAGVSTAGKLEKAESCTYVQVESAESGFYIEESGEEVSLKRVREGRLDDERGREDANEAVPMADCLDSESGRPGKRSVTGKMLYKEENERCDGELRRFGRAEKRCAEPNR